MTRLATFLAGQTEAGVHDFLANLVPEEFKGCLGGVFAREGGDIIPAQYACGYLGAQAPTTFFGTGAIL